MRYLNKNAAFEKTSNPPRKASWLSGVSLIAWAAIAGVPPQAAAQTISASQGTVNSTGADITIEQNVVITGTPGVANSSVDTATISSQGTIIATGGSGITNDAGNNQTSTIGTLINGNLGSISGQDGIKNTAFNTAATAMIGTVINDGNITAVQYGYWNNFGNLGVLVNQGTISAGSTGLYNYGNIETLTNIGTIAGASRAGIFNSVSSSAVGGNLIATLTNSGTISSTSSFGIDNSGGAATIFALTNQAGGTIAGYYTAILNLGTIGTLTNSGLISSAGNGSTGIFNEVGTIGILSNLTGGTIVGRSSGIYNTGTIGALTNNGLIAGADTDGIDNANSIASLANAAGGTILGHSSAVANFAYINTLTNAGFILGAAGGGTEGDGIYNNATIQNLTNFVNATISGTQGIVNSNIGVVGTLTNSGVITATSATTSGAVANYGSIGVLTNAGTIAAPTSQGIDNASVIGTLANLAAGTILGEATVVLNLGTIATLSNSGLISSSYVTGAGLANRGAGSTIGALENLPGGTISVLYTGIDNAGSIGALSNAGLISSATYDAVYNGGSIEAVTNLAGGTISAGYTGIFNAAAGIIGTLTNGGDIAGVGRTGIQNRGFVGVLANLAGGAISGTPSGIVNSNSGTVTVLTNSGSVTGAVESAIDNEGVMGTLANLAGGVLHGASNGVFDNFGTIGTLSNSGLITSPTYGIYSDGTIGAIINGGTIAGLTGIDLSTPGTTIFNGGTIASTNNGDAVYFGGVNTLILTTGSAVLGTIAGGGTASQIILQGTGALDNTIAGFDSGGSLAVTAGADWTGTGTWTVATVTNSGTFQGGTLGTPLTLTGDYLQNADGTLRVLVTPTTSTAFNVSGSATLAGGVTYLLAPGSYTPHVYPYLTAGTVTGAFTTIDYGVIPAGDATTQQRGDPTVDLVITAPFAVGPAAPATPSTPATPAAPATPATPATPQVALIVGPSDAAVFSAQAQALAQAADSDTASLLGKAGDGGAADSPACAAAPLSPDRTGGTAQLASTLAGAFCGAGGWVAATGALNEANQSGGAPAYHANTGGFLAGIDKIIGAVGTRIGIAFGYDKTQLTDKQGGGGAMGTTRVALYAAQPLGRFTLAGVIAYGNAADSTSRATGIGNLGENNTVNIFSGGVQLSTQLTVQQMTISPAAGLRVASIGGGAHFAESASGIAAAFAVHGKTAQYNSVQPYILLAARRVFVTESNVTITPEAQIGYEYEAGSRGVTTTVTGADGTVFTAPGNKLDAGDALLSAGVSAGRFNWSLFIDYTARLAGNWNSQTAEAGLTLRF